MDTLKTTFSGVSFPSTFPIGYPDQILTAGSLVLHDFSNSAGYDGGAAVPAAGTLLPNIAWQQAKDAIGSGDRTSLSPVFGQTGFAGSSSAIHKNEWSAKKGLHTIVSQATTVQGKYVNIPFPAAVLAYLLANTPGHDFYFSAWFQLTRAQLAPVGGSPQAFTFMNSTELNSANNYLCSASTPMPFTDDGVKSASTDRFVTANPNTPGAKLHAWGAKAWTGTKPASGVAANAWMVGAGNIWSAANANASPSRVLYRMYLEDRTVSGRTFAQVLAIDQALFAAAFASGGKFYNDSFTDPATIP